MVTNADPYPVWRKIAEDELAKSRPDAGILYTSIAALGSKYPDLTSRLKEEWKKRKLT